MPRKDGFQAAAEIRAIERENKRNSSGVLPPVAEAPDTPGSSGKTGRAVDDDEGGEAPERESPDTERKNDESSTLELSPPDTPAPDTGVADPSPDVTPESGPKATSESPATPTDPTTSTAPTASTGSIVLSAPRAFAVLGRTRIVAVTAMSSEAHRRRGLVECGIDVWMAKPVGIKLLKEEIDKVKQSIHRDQ